MVGTSFAIDAASIRSRSGVYPVLNRLKGVLTPDQGRFEAALMVMHMAFLAVFLDGNV